MWVCLDASKTIPLSILAQNPHKGLVREISQETSQEKREQEAESRQQKSEGRLLEHVDSGRVDQREKMSQHS